MIKEEIWQDLIRLAVKSMAASTSNDHVVGAAVLGQDGMMYGGTNYPVDNHRSTIHAEDSAVSFMLSRGEREVAALVTVAFDYKQDGSKSEVYFTYPCGSCRNLVAQYTNYGAPDEALIYWAGKIKTISEVYPKAPENVPVPDSLLLS